jgi:hypothetical protein
MRISRDDKLYKKFFADILSNADIFLSWKGSKNPETYSLCSLKKVDYETQEIFIDYLELANLKAQEFIYFYIESSNIIFKSKLLFESQNSLKVSFPETLLEIHDKLDIDKIEFIYKNVNTELLDQLKHLNQLSKSSRLEETHYILNYQREKVNDDTLYLRGGGVSEVVAPNYVMDKDREHIKAEYMIHDSETEQIQDAPNLKGRVNQNDQLIQTKIGGKTGAQETEISSTRRGNMASTEKIKSHMYHDTNKTERITTTRELTSIPQPEENALTEAIISSERIPKTNVKLINLTKEYIHLQTSRKLDVLPEDILYFYKFQGIDMKKPFSCKVFEVQDDTEKAYKIITCKTV